MPRFIIERELPGVGKSTDADLRAVARRANVAVDGLGGAVKWLHSYVVDDKSFCVFEAGNAELLREHARLAGFPANRISRVHAMVGPASAGP